MKHECEYENAKEYTYRYPLIEADSQVKNQQSRESHVDTQ